MLTFLPRRRPVRRAVLTERGQGFAVLLTAIAVIFWLVAKAKGLS